MSSVSLHTDTLTEFSKLHCTKWRQGAQTENGRPTKTDRNLLATKVEGKRDAINIKDAVKNDIKRWRGKKKKTGEKDGFD